MTGIFSQILQKFFRLQKKTVLAVCKNNLQGNTSLSLFSIEMQAAQACNFIQRDSSTALIQQVCEFCKIYKGNLFMEYTHAPASENTSSIK